MTPVWIVLNCVWESGEGVGVPPPQKNALMNKMFCTISGGLGPWIKYLWEASGTFGPFPILYFHKVYSQGESTRLGGIIEAGFLFFSSGRHGEL